MKLRSALLAATVLTLPFAASAQPVTGLYVGLGAGVNLMSQEKTNFSAGPFGFGSGNASLETGFAGLVYVGWGFGNGLRAELEGNFRANKFNKLSGGGGIGASVAAGGWEQKFGPMVNVLYDFNGLAPWVVPYVGVGVGGQWVNERNVNAYGGSPLVTARVANSTKASFAYQAILGAAWPLPQIMPGLAATTEFRYMGLAGNRSYSSTISSGALSVPGTSTFTNNNNYSLLLGIRYNFGVAPPPPVAVVAPAPAPARSYLVFFDWDKATLTDRARQIIKEAADNSTRVQYTRIEVNGYTDTSGTPRYNQGLSVRRAQAVAAELVKDGVPRNAISIQGFGDTKLLVPTGPGVREPQNRRVEIIIR
jgi:outer membrane protein OmpA-like peptidoglycan-associated protein